MMRKIFLLFTCILSFMSFQSCNKEKASEKEITLVMAEVNPDGTIAAEMDKAFKEKVEELSGGKIKIDLQLGGTLGDEESVMQILQSPGGSIQLERISAFNLASKGCEKSSLLVIPFTFASKEHFWKFAHSDSAKEILEEPYEDKIGVLGLFYGEEGFRHFFATKNLTSPSDFNDIKLRITADPIMKGLATGLKANPVSVGFGDLFSALQTGVADAAEQPIANYLANHFNKVAPYMVLDGHTLGVMEVIISSECWDSLSEDQKDILAEAGKYAGEVCRQISQAAEDKAKAQLVTEGAKLFEVTNPALWKQACSEIITESAKVNPELYQKILNSAK